MDLLTLNSTFNSLGSIGDSLSGLSLALIKSGLELSLKAVSRETYSVTNEGPYSSAVNDFLNHLFYFFHGSNFLSGGFVLGVTASYEHSSGCEHKCNLFHFFAFLKSVKQSLVY